MRIAHITDLHVEHPPGVAEIFNKRLLGAVNLYLLGRAGHFAAAARSALVEAVVALAPDAVVCTGDLTATATDTEFRGARTLLEPLLSRFPFVTLSGNHDVYTGESLGRFAEHFGAWSNGGKFPFVWPRGAVDFVGVETCQPDWLSRGRCGDGQLALLDTLLAASTRPAVVMIHYPLRGRGGAPYGPSTRNLVDAAALEAVLGRHPRVVAVLHGHEHHGFRTQLPSGVPVLNPGASGYAHLPERRRTAHFNLYTFTSEGTSFGVERFAFDGARFVPEAGGAYTTGG